MPRRTLARIPESKGRDIEDKKPAEIVIQRRAQGGDAVGRRTAISSV